MPFINVDGLQQRQPFPGYSGRFLHAEHVSVAFWTVEEGSGFPEHAHPHEQVAVVLEGRFEFTMEGEKTRVLEPGLAAVIPSNVRHSGRALTPCRLLDVFYPVREDYR